MRDWTKYCTGCGSFVGQENQLTDNWCNVCWDNFKPLPQELLKELQALRAGRDPSGSRPPSIVPTTGS